MIFTRGTPEGEITFREKDIRMLCPSDRKNAAGVSIFTLWIYLEGIGKPIAANYGTEQGRDEDFMRIRAAWQQYTDRSDREAGELEEIRTAVQSLQEAMDRTDAWMEDLRKEMEDLRKGKPKPAAKAPKTKKREPKPFVPPTMEEIVKHILENGYEKVARQKPEGIARRFVRYYAPDGKWRFKDGRPVKDWKKCMANWINRIDEDEETQAAGAPVKKNQFTQGVENNEYDYDQLEAELAAEEDPYEENNKEPEEKGAEAQAEGLPV